jgi:hypothetical protein
MDVKRGGAVESKVASPLLRSLSRPLGAIVLLVLPLFAEAKEQPRACRLSYQMQQPELPSDIAVKVDFMALAATRIAMDWWTVRLSTPARPVTWHVVENTDDCMIYIRHQWDRMTANKSKGGYTRVPDSDKYDGVATIIFINPWVVAHEIGHLIGCRHGAGIMRETWMDYARLSIDDDALHVALLARYKASTLPDSRTRAAGRASKPQ